MAGITLKNIQQNSSKIKLISQNEQNAMYWDPMDDTTFSSIRQKVDSGEYFQKLKNNALKCVFNEKIAAVILDEGLLAKWQNNALLKAKEYIDVRVILSCKNTRSKNIFKHFLYYLINFHSLRNSQTKNQTNI